MKIKQKLYSGFLMVVLLIGAVGYICLYQLHKISEPLNKDIPDALRVINETSRLDGLAQFIRYYDEVLTQSARNYAFTQDKKWEQRYRDVEPKLDKIIKESIWRGDEKDKEFFSSVDKANLALVEMEYEAIELVHNGQIEKAIKLLESNEYWTQKNIYEQGLRNYVYRKGVRFDEALAASTEKTELANSQAQNLIRTSTLLVLSFVAFALILSIGIGFLISYSISNPIAKLKAATAKIGMGQLDTQIETHSNDEIGQLASSFKKMVEDLKRTTTSIDSLNAVNEQLQSEITKRKETTTEIARLSRFPSENPNPVLRISKDGIILYGNESSRPILDIWGCQQGERVSEDLREAILQVLKTGKLYTPEVECGEKIYSLAFSPVKNADFVNVYGMDTTERKRAEDALEKLNKEFESAIRELSRSNKELQKFAHIAAHDLKAPLRAIGTLADWLWRDYGNKFDEEGREKIRLLTERAKRMSRHIDSVLRYSELGRIVEAKETIHLDLLIEEVIERIAPPENIEIAVEGDLPTITCEGTRMIQVFQNLLDNAVKYMDKSRGQITVGCVDEGDFWKFSVADNGPGIEQKYYGKIFEIFQTLLPRDELESTGIGLSIVKKIVEIYGGKIWIESKIGQGSTFFFTLPKQKVGIKDEKLETNIAR